MREIPFGNDGDFSKDAMINRINGDLSNNFGNLIQRVLSFIFKNSNQTIDFTDEILEFVFKLPVSLNAPETAVAIASTNDSSFHSGL